MSGPGLIDPSLVDLLLTFPASSDAYPTVGRALIELGEDELAFRVLSQWEPPRNRELYTWHKRDRNAAGMLAAISSPYPGAPLPILELMYRQDDASLRRAARFVLDADLRGENLELISEQARRGLGIKPGETQLLDLAVLLMGSDYDTLSARLFERYLQRDYGGDTEVAKYLAMQIDPVERIHTFLPGGLQSLSTGELLMYASSQENRRYDFAAITALLHRDIFKPEMVGGLESLRLLLYFLQRLEDIGQVDEVNLIFDRYSDQIATRVSRDPEQALRWSPFYVKYGRSDVLVRVAEANWPGVRDGFLQRLSEHPQSANSSPVGRIAELFAMGGDYVRAKEALDLARTRTESAPSMSYSDLLAMRPRTLGKCEEAMQRHLQAGTHSLSSAVYVGTGHIQNCDDSVSNKRRMARRLVGEMLFRDVFFEWQAMASSLIRLEMYGELRALIDAIGKRPHLSDDQREDLFLYYLALDDPASAEPFAFPHSVKATFLLSVLGDWDESVHGATERLLDVHGRNVFEEGVMGFRQLVPEHPFWIGNFDFLLQGVRGSRSLTERALAELRHCLSLVSDSLALSEAEGLIQRLVVSDKRALIDRATQRRVADVVGERLGRLVAFSRRSGKRGDTLP